MIAEYCGQDILRDIINLMVLPKPDNSSQPFQFIELMQLDDKLMQKIYIWVEATVAQELTITAMATALNITERTVSRKVKKLTNLSCAQFMRLIKLHQASEYLIYGTESVSSIGSRLGFSDDAAFVEPSKMFCLILLVNIDRRLSVSPSVKIAFLYLCRGQLNSANNLAE